MPVNTARGGQLSSPSACGRHAQLVGLTNAPAVAIKALHRATPMTASAMPWNLASSWPVVIGLCSEPMACSTNTCTRRQSVSTAVTWALAPSMASSAVATTLRRSATRPGRLTTASANLCFSGAAKRKPIGAAVMAAELGLQPMAKPFHPCGAARPGLMSAQQGHTASPKALEAPRGTMQTISSKNDWRAITYELGQRFEISINTCKPFACGVVIHASIDACAQLREQVVQPKKVERLEVKVHSLVLELTGKKEPVDG